MKTGAGGETEESRMCRLDMYDGGESDESLTGETWL